MSRRETDEEIIASIWGSLGLGRSRKRRQAKPSVAPVLRWTDADNLGAREARIVGGPCDGLRVAVRFQPGRGYRYPDVFDLGGYEFDPDAWAFRVKPVL